MVLPNDIGVINHIITKILIGTYPHNYEQLNAIIGVMECTKLEFYRRVVVPYEDRKMEENGDVY